MSEPTVREILVDIVMAMYQIVGDIEMGNIDLDSTRDRIREIEDKIYELPQEDTHD